MYEGLLNLPDPTPLIDTQWWFQLQDKADFMLESFQFFADCGIQQLVVQWATKLNTLQGFLSYAINLSFVLTPMLMDSQWQQDIIKSIETTEFYGRASDYEVLGKYVGTIAASLIEFQVPSSQYMYGMTVLDELNAGKF